MNSGSVLCAFDATRPSMDASLAAAWLASELGMPLELVNVLDPGALPALPRTGAAREPGFRAELREDQKRRAQAQAQAEIDAAVFALAGDDIGGRVLTGIPVPALVHEAEERRATMIVCGTAARRGFDHILMGTVAGGLAAEAPCAVVIVPADAVLRDPGPLLVGDDGSDHAGRAVRHAEALAARLERELVRLHVEDGDPVAGLAREGKEKRAPLTVVGTRGRGPLRGHLFGSVSTGLVRAAGRPVMLVSQRAGDPPAGRPSNRR